MNAYPKKIYLNGEIVAPEAAKISVFDRGFLFGDGIYEVMVRIGGRFFYEQAHLQRLDRCLQAIDLEFDTAILATEIPRLLRAADLEDKDCLLYLQVTRGVAPRQHAFPKGIAPTVMMYAIPKTLPDINTVHASVVAAQDLRWSRCDIKMTSLLGNVMANQHAVQQGRYETLLVRDGIITEASHCNVFFVRDKVVHTHPANHLILDGITRQVVLGLCSQLNLEVRDEGLPFAMIPSMDEAFLTGTSTQIASIKQIDGHHFYHSDRVGPITQLLQQAFLEAKRNA